MNIASRYDSTLRPPPARSHLAIKSTLRLLFFAIAVHCTANLRAFCRNIFV